jgi:hypothetical protein
MEKSEIDIEARLYALELMVANLLTILCVTTSQNPEGMIAKVKVQMVDGVKNLTLPDYEDAAMSDLVSAEIESALAVLVSMASAQIADFRRNLQK